MNSKETEMRLNETSKAIQKEIRSGVRQPLEHGRGGFVGTRTTNVVYDEFVGSDYDRDEVKELINNKYGFVFDRSNYVKLSPLSERVSELEEQIKLLKKVIRLSDAELTVKLINNGATPNQVRSIIAGYKPVLSPPSLEDILTRADVMWYDDVVQCRRVVYSRNVEQPLTPHERQTMYDMWAHQSGQLNCVFYEQGYLNSKQKLVDEFPKK